MSRRGGLVLLLVGCNLDTSGIGGGTTSDSGASTSPDAGSGTADPSTTANSTGAGGGSGSTASMSVGPSGPDSSGTSGPSSTEDSGSSEDSSTGPPPATLCEPELPGMLRACYDFSGIGGGTLTDLSGNGNHGAVMGVAVVPGPFGEAAAFDGSGQISVPDSASLDITGSLTIEAWINPDEVPTTNRVGILDNDGQYSLFIYASGEYRCDAGNVQVFSGPVDVGQWSHVACVLDGASNTLHMVLNGVELLSDGPTLPINTGDDDPMAFGDDSPSFAETFSGAIGGARIWNTVLTPQQLCEAAGELCR